MSDFAKPEGIWHVLWGSSDTLLESKHILREAKIAGTMCGQTTVGTISRLSRLLPSKTSNAASWTLVSQPYGNTNFSTFHPLTSSNFRLNDVETPSAVEIIRSTKVAMSGVGRSPKSKRQMRVSGKAAVNLLNMAGLSTVATNSVETSGALVRGSGKGERAVTVSAVTIRGRGKSRKR